MTRRLRGIAVVCFSTLTCAGLSAASLPYYQINLASDLPGEAPNTNANLVNPWGITAGPSTPLWINENGTGFSAVFNGAGQAFPTASPIVVSIPPAAGGTPPSAPTGIAFNSATTDFGGAHFLFGTEDGTIAGWSSGSSAVLEVDNSASGAVYKGLAIANNGTGNLIYAANFNAGTIDVFNSTFAPVTVPGGFSDPTIPSGFAPFDIQNIGGQLYVSYAQQDAAKHDDVAGPGNGYIDVFDTNGNLVKRLVSNGPLNSPWGMVVAPAGFGGFGGDLLVGNFGDGTINAFDPSSGAFIGTVSGTNGSAIVNQGLWGLTFGNGLFGTNTNTLYLTAGIPGPDMVESHGLFASIDPVPEPLTLWLSGGGLLALWAGRRRSLRHR